MDNTVKNRRACLIGIPKYDREEILDLPIVRHDVARLQEVLENSDYKIETHCPQEGETGISRSNLRTILLDACRSASTGETLIIYFSGHGGHFKGKDYLVPSDANLNDPEDLDEYLLPVDFITNAARDCRAETLLFFIDACREGIKLDSKTLGLHSWALEDLRISQNRTLITVFACGKGQLAQFYRKEDGSGYSLFTEALCLVLDPKNPARLLGEVLEATDKELDTLVRKHKKNKQNIWVLGETTASRSKLVQPICDGKVAANSSGPNPWVTAVSNSRLWMDTPLSQDFKQAALTIATACWDQQQAAHQALPGDPWVDDKVPVRFLAALRILTHGMDGLNLNPAETALLCIAPLLRDAVLARALEHMVVFKPLSLEDTGSGVGMRAILEKVHRAYPRLLRKAGRLRESGKNEEANQVAIWLMHRALLREPSVWAIKDNNSGLLDGPLLDVLRTINQTKNLISKSLDSSRLLEMARCCFATPDRISRQDRPGALIQKTHFFDEFGEEVEIREQLLGYLLLVAGAMSIEPRLLSEVLVEHIGLSNTPNLADLIAEFATAEWEPDGSGRRLKASCTHPATDYALSEQVEYANGMLIAAQRAVQHSDCAPLAKLPSRFNADGVKPIVTPVGPAYQTPHLRFRLAQDQVLELLMGEQLYGEPAMAIRELYQNALDACRYAQARLTYLERSDPLNFNNTWQGQIQFKQGVGEDGRAFIECDDNGIGMSTRELTDIFTRAGQRFADTPEFIEEQAEWLTQNVRLYPNSQFGIGVLSYFMLADDFEVETCRMDRKGKPGSALHAEISGSGSLIRLQDGNRKQCGTRIRLYLNQTKFKEKVVSVVETLSKLLWVADFSTIVQDDKRTLHWSPGKMGHDDAHELQAVICVTDNPNFWWRAPYGYEKPSWEDYPFSNYFSKGSVLADGILTESDIPSPSCIVNLREEKRPRLSVDRKHANKWDSGWVKHTANIETTPLLSWHATCFSMVLRLAKDYPLAAGRLWKEIASRNSTIRLCNEYWPFTKRYSMGKISRLASGTVSVLDISPIAGCFVPDLDFFEEFYEVLTGTSEKITQTALYLAYKYFPEGLQLSRLKALALGISGDRLKPLVFALDKLPAFSPLLDDDKLLHEFCNRDTPGTKSKAMPGRILNIATELEKLPKVILLRLRELGFILADPQPNWESIEEVSVENFSLMHMGMDDEDNWLASKISPKLILSAAAEFGKSPAQVTLRLQELGFLLPDLPPDWDKIGNLRKDDISILPDIEVVQTPWLERKVPIGNILILAAALKKTPDEIVSRLRALGFLLPGISRNWDEIGPLTENDEVLLSNISQDSRVPNLDLFKFNSLFQQKYIEIKEFDPLNIFPFTPINILSASAKLEKQPSQVVSRLQELGFSLSEDQPDWDSFSSLNSADQYLIPTDLDGDGPWLERKVPIRHILQASSRCEKTPKQIVARLRELGFSSLELPPGWETLYEIQKEDWDLIPSDIRGEGSWLEQRISTLHILFVASYKKKNPAEIVARLRTIGFSLPGIQPKWEEIGTLTEEDSSLIYFDWKWDDPWLERVVHLEQILELAIKLEKTPLYVAERMRTLGFSSLPELPTDWKEVGPINQEYTALLHFLNQHYFGYDISIANKMPCGIIWGASVELGMHPVDVVTHLRSMGFPLTDDYLEWVEIDKLDKLDIILISDQLDGESPWFRGEITNARILKAAVKTGKSPMQISSRLRTLGFSLPENQPDWETIGLLTREDIQLISKDLDGGYEWLNKSVVSFNHILKAVDTLDKSLLEIAMRMHSLGFDIQTDNVDNELAILVKICDGCTSEEAAERLSNAGLRP